MPYRNTASNLLLTCIDSTSDLWSRMAKKLPDLYQTSNCAPLMSISARWLYMIGMRLAASFRLGSMASTWHSPTTLHAGLPQKGSTCRMWAWHFTSTVRWLTLWQQRE